MRHGTFAAALTLAGAALGAAPLSAQAAREPELAGRPVTTVSRITGGGTVLQVLPGPAPYAAQAMAFMRGMPGEVPAAKKQEMQKIARMGPFSNRTARISGEFRGAFTDAGESGDAAEATAEFTTQDGAKWRVMVTGVDPSGNPPMEPHWGGVGTNHLLHGSSGHHNPFVPTVNLVAMWGTVDVWKDGQKVKEGAPVHIMLTSHTRSGPGFTYQCRDCVGRPMDELHLILVPKGEADKYPAPGGFLHIMWENARLETSTGTGAVAGR